MSSDGKINKDAKKISDCHDIVQFKALRKGFWAWFKKRISYIFIVVFTLVTIYLLSSWFDFSEEFYKIESLESLVGLVGFPLALIGLWLLNRRTAATEKQVENTNKQIELGIIMSATKRELRCWVARL